MAKMDYSDSPIKGFVLIHNPEGLYLVCRAREMSVNHFYKRIKRISHLEDVLRLAAEHRAECNEPIQLATSVQPLPFDIVEKD